MKKIIFAVLKVIAFLPCLATISESNWVVNFFGFVYTIGIALYCVKFTDVALPEEDSKK